MNFDPKFDPNSSRFVRHQNQLLAVGGGMWRVVEYDFNHTYALLSSDTELAARTEHIETSQFLKNAFFIKNAIIRLHTPAGDRFRRQMLRRAFLCFLVIIYRQFRGLTIIWRAVLGRSNFPAIAI